MRGVNTTKRNNEDSSFEYSDSADNGAKKMRMESAPPSKVIHLRSLPSDVTEREVIHLGMKFGKITNILMLKGKNQAFLEMEDEDVAIDMVNSSEENPPTIRQRIIYIQFSNHKELRTDNSKNQLQTQSLLRALQQTEGGTNHVLRTVIENMAYPINVEILHKIFSKFGTVLKVITFTKNNQFQALIQMGDSIETESAKLALDGQNIYNSCCTLRIEFSKLSYLNVKYNNEKSYDFTRPDLPSGDGPSRNSILGNTGRGRGLMPSPSSNHNALAAVLQQSQIGSMSPRAVSSALNAVGLRSNLSELVAQLSGPTTPQNSVLHVSNLNKEMIEPQVLFTLFGVYGDVIRVKILFNRKDNALVQMADHSQAQTVIKYLNGIYLFDQALQIRMSHFNQVQIPKDGQEGAYLTQSYINSPLHRFKKPGSKNFQNIFPPSSVLHLSNIPEDITEDFLVETFSEYGTVEEFKFFSKDHKMALIKMSSVDESVKCLVNLHNFKLSDTNHLRVSFSKGHISKTA